MTGDTVNVFQLRGRAAKAARIAREDLAIDLLLPLDDIVERVEAAGVAVVILDLGEGIAGAYLQVGGGAVAFVNGIDAPQRQRFTLAHEFGHHRLGHARSVDAPPALADYSGDPVEMQANVFAAEFLMPRAASLRWCERHDRGPTTLETVVRFAAAFGVSAEAACHRFRTAKACSPEQCARILAEIHAGEHIGMVEALGLDVPDDVIARAAGHLPRLPDSIRDSPFGALLTGQFTVDEVALQQGRRPAEIRAMLAATGLDALLP